MATYILTSEGLVDKRTGILQPKADFVVTGFPKLMGSDDQEPLLSYADGKTYTSKAAMRESYKASNNPQGVNYIEVGNDTKKLTPQKPKSDRKAIRDALDRAESEMRTRGQLP